MTIMLQMLVNFIDNILSFKFLDIEIIYYIILFVILNFVFNVLYSLKK